MSIELSQTKKLANEFIVYSPKTCKKVRIGNNKDGGYILLDHNLENIERLYSYGVSYEYSFDEQMAQKYSAVARMFDPTVTLPNKINENLFFKKIGIATNEGTIVEHVRNYGDIGKRMILKMDVEGAEWEWLAETTADELKMFDQILIEFHNLGQIEKHQSYAQGISKINELFFLFHVHANNYAPMRIYEDIILPDVIECSFVRKDLLTCELNKETRFPVADIDYASDEGECSPADWRLNFWPFISQQSDELETEARINAINSISAYKKIKTLEFIIQNIESSSSWKITYPIRRMGEYIRG